MPKTRLIRKPCRGNWLAALKNERDLALAAKDRAFAELQPETRITEDKNYAQSADVG